MVDYCLGVGKVEFVVLDLEWNQYPGSSRAPVSRSGFVMMNEIVQIGAVRTDERFHVLNTFAANVRLRGNRKLSWQVARVITLTEEELKSGISFPEAYRALRRFCDGASGILSWGIDDQKVLLGNSQFYRLPPMQQPWYDAQNLYRTQLTGENPRTSLESAEAHYELESQSRQAHDALSDALTAARVLSRFDAAEVLGRYQDVENVSPRRGLFSGSTPVFLKQNLARDYARHQVLPCPVCGQPLKYGNLRFGRKENWQEVRGCPDHGEYIGRFHLRCRSGRYYSVLFSVHAIDDEMRRIIEHKRRRLAEKAEDGGPAEQ
ncbi:MAG: exonuclease domain-containing protein [Clostridia bacterium]|nr:exonuclease domain-containing protein [Clostridia bacterium]